MPNVRFTGETGSRRHRGRYLKNGEVIEVSQSTAEQLVELGCFARTSDTPAPVEMGDTADIDIDDQE